MLQGATWTEQQKFTPINPHPTDGEYFACAVAVDGSTLVVGAPYKTFAASDFQSSAYVILVSLSANGVKCARTWSIKLSGLSKTHKLSAPAPI